MLLVVRTGVRKQMLAVVTALASLAVAGAGLVAGASPAAAADDVGEPGPTIASSFGLSAPLEGKVQRRTWYGRGTFWAVMAKSRGTGFSIWRRDRVTGEWHDTTVTVDARSDTAADAFNNGRYVFVATNVVAGNNTSTKTANAYLHRFQWSTTAAAWVRSPGYPKVITTTSLSALAIAQESGTGRVIAAFTWNAKPYYAVTSGSENEGDGTSFGAKTRVASSSAATLTRDDVASVTSAGGVTTMMWSNQSSGSANGFHAARHKDGSSWSGSSAWTLSRVSSGTLSADNHISLQALDDGSGRVYAAVKTSANDASPADKQAPLLRFARFVPSSPGSLSGSWSLTTLTRVGDGGTRPSLVLDRSNGKAYVYYAAPGSPSGVAAGRFNGTVFRKVVDYSSPSSTSGNTDVAMRNGGSDKLNDVSGMAGNATATSGIVEIAVEKKSEGSRYWTAVKKAATPAPAVPASPQRPTVSPKAGRSVEATVTRGALNGGTFVKTVTWCTSTNGGTTRGYTSTSTATTVRVTVAGLTAGKSYSCYAYTWSTIGRGPASERSSTFTAKA